MWKLTRNFTRKRTSIPVLHVRNGLKYLAADKAEALADSWEEQFQLNPITNQRLFARANIKLRTRDGKFLQPPYFHLHFPVRSRKKYRENYQKTSPTGTSNTDTSHPHGASNYHSTK